MTREQLIKALHDIAASEVNPMLKSQSAHLFAAAEMLEVDGVPVAIVDAKDDGYWADILPDRSVKVGQQLYTAPHPAMAWQPIETAPKDGSVLLLGYRN